MNQPMPRHNTRIGPSAFSLIETVVALALMSVILLAIGSTVVITAYAIPDGNDPLSATIDSRAFTARLAAELSEAVYLANRTQHGVTLVVPDRDGDGTQERITYAWSGTAGDLVTRDYNGTGAVSVGPAASVFALAYQTTTETVTFPGPAVEDTTESELGVFDSTPGSDIEVKSDKWWGQHIHPALDADAIGYRVTRVTFWGEQEDTNYTKLFIRVRPTDKLYEPEDDILATTTINESALPTTPGWVEAAINQSRLIDAGDGFTVTFEAKLGEPAMLGLDDDHGGLLESDDGGNNWSRETSKAVRMYAYGKVTRAGADIAVQRKVIDSVHLTFRAHETGSASNRLTVTLPNTPPAASGYWDADFEEDPTATDINGDGSGDWTGSNKRLLGKLLSLSSPLLTQTSNDFDTVTIIKARMRTTATGSAGPGVWINADVGSDGKAAPLHVTASLETDSTQTVTLEQLVSGTEVTLTEVKGLSTGLLAIELVIDADSDTVHLSIDGADHGTYRYTRGSLSANRGRVIVDNFSGTGEVDRVTVIAEQ